MGLLFVVYVLVVAVLNLLFGVIFCAINLSLMYGSAHTISIAYSDNPYVHDNDV